MIILGYNSPGNKTQEGKIFDQQFEQSDIAAEKPNLAQHDNTSDPGES